MASATLLFTSVLATPMPLGNLGERDPDTVNNLPNGDKDCNGNTYSSDDIKTTISFSWQAVRDKKQYSMSFLFPWLKNPQQAFTLDNLRWSLLLADHRHRMGSSKGQADLRVPAQIHSDSNEHAMVRLQSRWLCAIRGRYQV